MIFRTIKRKELLVFRHHDAGGSGSQGSTAHGV
jgi:hypothetical protein